ncbi:MAG: SDR family oxidoreductase [Thermoleophilaceae bacterium]|nr:SDR family oxidoreductase [Thermoleophilaceae bacterium]
MVATIAQIGRVFSVRISGADTALRRARSTLACVRPVADQTILVTGATDGLGRELARELAQRGATVLLHGRDKAKAEEARRSITEATGNDRIEVLIADLASMGAVRGLAAQVRDATDGLHALVNNAGIAGPPRTVTEDGVELHLAVNYLSHFLLTKELFPLLLRSAPSRIVNVSSIGQTPIDFDDPMMERGYDPMRAYCQSKLAQISFTFELAGHLRDTEVTVNALHPATLMDTKMVRDYFGMPRTSVEEGTEATLRLVTDPSLDGVSGRYFDGLHESGAHAQANDRDARKQLWELSEQLTAD